MNSLIDYLLRFGQLNSHQIDLINQLAVPVVLKKDAYFSQAGQISRRVGFVQSGILPVCYYTHTGQEVTRYFIDEINFVVDLTSFMYQVSSTEYIQAVTDCQLLVFSQDILQELSATIIGWDELIHKITTKALLDKVNRVSPMLAETGSERYLHFMQRYPSLVHRIPLTLLASYLGLTKSSLSRIRRNSRN